MTARPHIQSFTLGDFATNCYVVTVPPRPECWIVDCGYRPMELLDHIRLKGLQPVKLILTHAHCDHMAGVDQALSRFSPLPLACHALEHRFCTEPLLNLSAMIPPSVTCSAPTESIGEGDRLELAGTQWRVWHTPGHSPGSVCLIHDDSEQALVGDTLFKGSIGRTDFPTSNPKDMQRSLARLLTLPEDTTIFPGHMEPTTIGAERRSNPFLRNLPVSVT